MIKKFERDISIVFSGEAGQGIQTLERLLLRLFHRSGYHVFSYSEFMSRIRGGNNSTEIRISEKRVSSYISRIDIFVPFGAGALDRFSDRIDSRTLIIGDSGYIDTRYRNDAYTVIDHPFVELSKQIGGAIYANIIMYGMLAGLFGIDPARLHQILHQSFPRSNAEISNNNIAAADNGYAIGAGLIRERKLEIFLDPSEKTADEILLNGAEAIMLGGLAGGCNFVSSYPMSPSTDVLVNFARFATDFGIVVEQAEDEIGAINMALGSWYAGGRAMVTTSGGGFALMVEALSLAGAIESPLVIHLGQRPGPATGLPTRTEQGDLLFALFAGHGEFPRVLFAPGDLADGYTIMQRAFYIAARYQVPVIVLTDQYFIDSQYAVPALEDLPDSGYNHTMETDPDYQRYRFTGSGISPRGIPGKGSGTVCVDSDEHDESGHITENFSVRTAMVDKRLRKLNAMTDDILKPRFFGPTTCHCLLVCWGSTMHVVCEALAVSGRTDVSVLHFSQVYPLHPETASYLKRAAVKVIIENNATAQFATIITLYTGIAFDRKLLKYNGMPFMREEITEFIRSLEEPTENGNQYAI